MLHGHLHSLGGHTYGETLGFIESFRRRGLGLSVFAARDAQPEILAETGARPVYGWTDADQARFPPAGGLREQDVVAGMLADFLRDSAMVARSCREMVDLAGSRPDIVLMPWASTHDFNGLAEWLADMAPGERPRLVLNIIRPEPSWRLDAARIQASGDFTFFRFASHRLAALAPPGGLVITSVEPRMCKVISALSGTDCAPAPMQKDYLDPAQLEALRPMAANTAPTVSVMGSVRWEKGGELLADVMSQVCAARPDVQVSVQVSDERQRQALAEALGVGAPVKAAIQVGELSREDYWRRLLASDLLLMPYIGPAYALMPSGPFAEAVFCGIPVVAPRDTWMGDRLAEGWGAGETFATSDGVSIAQATLAALGRLQELKARAAGQGEAWRRTHGIDAYLDHVFRRLGL